MSRPITPISPGPEPFPAHLDPSTLPARSPSARHSSRPVSYLGAHATDTASHYSQPPGAPGETSELSAAAEAPNETPEPAAVEGASELGRTTSHTSVSQILPPSRGGTLKKKASLHKSGSLKRTPSKRSSYAGSVRSLKLGEKEKYDETEGSNSVFYCPVPTAGNPTELLANRFQAWRKVLKDLINYFSDLHKTYETRAKSLASTANVINNTSMPSNFLATGGLGEAAFILRDFHRQAVNEAGKARDLENEVIIQLTGLRSDLQQKIKEIKSLSGDFKNSVDKEQDSTKRVVRSLQESLGMVDLDAASTTGKGDPFLVKMAVDRQVERQIDEENYLHRAYLNLEASGRELESIVVGEIQKAYNVLAGILRREADDAYDTAEKLKEGPLAMAKDHEWDMFTTNNNQMVDPRNPVRQVSHIVYPGKDHPAAIEVRSGMLERKSKYLKNYTPGWYILSPTHLHEFKSADRISSQSPVMSLYLPEQKLGSHSEVGSSSHKFMLKGRQTGSMHRGHSWVFRAETHDTMLAWYGDVKELTEKRGEERNEFVRRQHARSLSGNSLKPASIISSEGAMEEDEADRVAFSGEQSVRGNSLAEGMGLATAAGIGIAGVTDDDDRSEAGWRPPPRPSPGGRFPSDVNVQRGLQAPLSPSSGESSDRDRDVIAAAGALPGSGVPFAQTSEMHTELQAATEPPVPRSASNQYLSPQTANVDAAPSAAHQYTSGSHPNVQTVAAPPGSGPSYGEWLAPAAAVAGVGALGAGVLHHQQEQRKSPSPAVDSDGAIPNYGESSAPIPVATAPPTNAPTGPRAMSETTTAPTSSGTETGTLSTVPTSTGFGGGHDGTLDAYGVYLGPKTLATDPKLSAVNPAGRTKSHATISDLHIPGEYPATPGLSEEAKPYPNAVQG